jgi:hypothetical protein
MTVHNITAGASLAASASAGGRFFLPGANTFADTLNIGQIIQGRVLRGFDENRYLVAFSAGERVVDSAIPLTAGENLYGRVVGLGDRVELQRVFSNAPAGDARSAPGPESTAAPPAGSNGATIFNILQRYRVELTEADRSSLTRAARAAEDPQALGLAAAMLSKLGLPQSSVLLDTLYQAQLATGLTNRTAESADPNSLPQVIATSQQSTELEADSIRQLADLLTRITQDKSRGDSAGGAPEGLRGAADSSGLSGAIPDSTGRGQANLFSDDESRRNAQSALADRLLNAQTGGVVSHRYGLLPLLVGGRLVELSFALFEQRRAASQPQGLQHRQVHFSIQTQQLGQVDVLARITGGHVRLQINTGSDSSTSQAAQYVNSLEGALLEGGWNVDEVAYGTQADNQHNAAVRSVVEHVVSLDCLNRLV